MELDTLARHGMGVVVVVGNNGIWGLEKHPMEWLYGYSVVADLRPGTRYDLVAEALGCHGELVLPPGPSCARRWCGRWRPAGPALVNRADRPGCGLPAAVQPGPEAVRPPVGGRRRRSPGLRSPKSLRVRRSSGRAMSRVGVR